MHYKKCVLALWLSVSMLAACDSNTANSKGSPTFFDENYWFSSDLVITSKNENSIQTMDITVTGRFNSEGWTTAFWIDDQNESKFDLWILYGQLINNVESGYWKAVSTENENFEYICSNFDQDPAVRKLLRLIALFFKPFHGVNYPLGTTAVVQSPVATFLREGKLVDKKNIEMPSNVSSQINPDVEVVVTDDLGDIEYESSVDRFVRHKGSWVPRTIVIKSRENLSPFYVYFRNQNIFKEMPDGIGISDLRRWIPEGNSKDCRKKHSRRVTSIPALNQL